MNARDIGEYIAEFTPTNGTPTKPCGCGDRVYYRFTPDGPWLCRTCPRPATTWRMADCWHYPQCDPPQHLRSTVDRWFVLP